MKFRFVICNLLTAMLFSFGCAGGGNGSGAGPETNAEESNCYDFVYSTFGSLGRTEIIETSTAVYYLDDTILRFSDKDGMDLLPLCSRPNCMHNNEDCDAWVDTGSGIWSFNGHVYWVESIDNIDVLKEGPRLFRMKLDGTAHEQLLRLPIHEFDFKPTSATWSIFYTNKYLDCTYTAFNEEDDSFGTESWCYRVRLDTLEITDLSASRKASGNENEGRGGLPLAGKGDLVYYIDLNQDPPVINVTDLASDEALTLGAACEAGKGYRLPYIEGCFGLVGNALMYVMFDDSTAFGCLYRFDLGTNEFTLTAEGNMRKEKWFNISCDRGYIYRHYYIANGGDSSEFGFYVFNSELELVDKCMYSDERMADLPRIIVGWQTQRYVFAYEYADPEKMSGSEQMEWRPTPQWYIDLEDVGTGNLMWRRWAPGA